MSELDDLRRIAYGRATGAAEETAAAEARAALDRHESRERQERAEHEAADFARSRAVATDSTSPDSTVAGPDAHADPLTLNITEVHDEPGYLHRLATSWRVWAVPAFTAFVVGIVLTVASVIFLLRAPVGDGTAPDYVVTSGETVDAPIPGNLEVATAVLNSRQSLEDKSHPFDSSIEIEDETAHALRITADQQVYAAISVDGDICMMVVDIASAISSSTCLAPSQFVTQGIWLGMLASGHELKVHWDGIVVTETWK